MLEYSAKSARSGFALLHHRRTKEANTAGRTKTTSIPIMPSTPSYLKPHKK